MPAEMTTAQRLASFFETCMQNAWQGHDMEGGELQDMAKELGLLKVEPFDPAKHDNGEIDFPPDPGDDWFTFTDEVSTLLADAQLSNIPD